LKVSYILQDSIARWITEMRKVKDTISLPRQHVVAFCPGDFKDDDSRSLAMDKICDFLGSGRNPTVLKLVACAFGGNIPHLSNSHFETNCELIDVQGMGLGAKGVISKKPIAADDVVAIYFGNMVTAACSNTMKSDYLVRVNLLMSDGSNQDLVLVGGRDITGPAAFINDCRSEIQNSGVATQTDLARVNVRLVHANICGIPIVFVMATKEIAPHTFLLLDYGVQFWRKWDVVRGVTRL
jgi:hypothetical protein